MVTKDSIKATRDIYMQMFRQMSFQGGEIWTPEVLDELLHLIQEVCVINTDNSLDIWQAYVVLREAIHERYAEIAYYSEQDEKAAIKGSDSELNNQGSVSGPRLRLVK